MRKTCETCRYWSQLIAYADERGLFAYCLNEDSEEAPEDRYTSPKQTCSQWAEATHGTIDLPDFPGAYDD